LPNADVWLERYDVGSYQRIVEADRKSCDRLNGHGNAIAQVYNHIIMPSPTSETNRLKSAGVKKISALASGAIPKECG
jgi:hypothetical protein